MPEFKTKEEYEKWKAERLQAAKEKLVQDPEPSKPARIISTEVDQNNNKKILLKIILPACLVLIILIGGFYYITGTPRYSFYKYVNAIKNHDPETALKYIDIDSVVDNLVKNIIPKEDKPAENQWEEMGRNLAKTMFTSMLPALKETMKNNLKAAISNIDDKSQLASINKKSVWDFDIRSEGKTAIITPKQDNSVSFKMIKTTEGFWKIIEIINLDMKSQVKN